MLAISKTKATFFLASTSNGKEKLFPVEQNMQFHVNSTSFRFSLKFQSQQALG